MRRDRWHIYEDHSGEWRWKRTAPNGEVVGASSEGYVGKSSCIDNAVRNGMPEDAISVSVPTSTSTKANGGE